jgi:hypothetical protein
MTSTFLLSEAKFREFTDVNDNLDTTLIKNGIREAQDIHLQRIIGTKLYNSLLSQVDAGPIWTSSAYETLVNDYIQDFLLYAAYYEVLEAIYIRPKNNGLLTPTGGENSIEVDRSLFNVKRQSVENKQEFYAEKLSQYISENENTFPELSENNKAYEQNPDYSTQYRSPIVFNRNVKQAGNYKWAKAAGLRVTNSAYNQYPWGSDVE